MSDYKPTIPISLNTAWVLMDILKWMNVQPMMTELRKKDFESMADEISNGLDALYREREDQSMYFKAIVDDMVDDISAMLEHQYNVSDLVELNEKQLEEAFWETINGGYLKDVEPDKLVCLEKRLGKAPRVRILSDAWDAVIWNDGFTKAEYLSMEFLKDVFIFWDKEKKATSCDMAVGMREGKCTSLTQKQVQELMKEWGNAQ